MFTEVREHPRLSIPRYYLGGAFHLADGERRYHYIRANDISMSGIGVDLPAPAATGADVKLRFTGAGWRTDLSGVVMWCVRADRTGINQRSYMNYRVGIRLDPRNTEDNALLYLAIKNNVEGGRAPYTDNPP